ncbi:MAG: hypothetical protein ACLTLQ_01070 [[Clostridium] scindens]
MIRIEDQEGIGREIMKYVVLLSDGMAGRPLLELNGRTTLEAAATPVMDCLSKVSEVGMASMVPEGMAPGSDTANLAVMGHATQSGVLYRDALCVRSAKHRRGYG